MRSADWFLVTFLGCVVAYALLHVWLNHRERRRLSDAWWARRDRLNRS